jgi:hypothetical protein
MSYDFNGSSHNLVIGTQPVSVTPMTFACWFYSDLSHAGALMSISDSAGNNGWRMTITSSNTLVATAEAGGLITGSTATTTATFSNTTWNHGCAVFASSTSRTIYLNGGNAVVSTGTRSPGSITRLDIGSRRNSSASTNWFNGKIAEVGIWDASLTADEINSLSKGVCCALVRPQSLVFYAPLIRNLFDYSKSTSAITNNGATVFDLHPRVYL